VSCRRICVGHDLLRDVVYVSLIVGVDLLGRDDARRVPLVVVVVGALVVPAG
jgi:hypothetical protein